MQKCINCRENDTEMNIEPRLFFVKSQQRRGKMFYGKLNNILKKNYRSIAYTVKQTHKCDKIL